MASSVFKVLGQTKPAAASLTDSYTVPASTQVTISSLVVANQSATPTSFRVSCAIAGAVDTAAQYLYYDIVIAGNDTFVATIGVTLGAGDIVRVYNALASCSFNLFGVEKS